MSTMNQHNVEQNNKIYDPTLISKQYNVPEDGIFDWKPLYYAYLKRVEIAEGLQCLQDKLYNLAKQI